jgi:putative phosphoesterase
MKWMIASDIHGSGAFCQRLLEAYDREGADKLLLLGDILYHGPRNALPYEYAPKAVIELLNARKNDILCVRGNCDAEVDQMVLDFPIMADYAIFHEGDITVFATHGHIYHEKNLPKMSAGTVLLNGHTHIPKCTVHEDYTYMNPGSVSIPKENSWHGYMIWENDTFTWYNLDGEQKNRFEMRKE